MDSNKGVIIILKGNLLIFSLIQLIQDHLLFWCLQTKISIYILAQWSNTHINLEKMDDLIKAQNNKNIPLNQMLLPKYNISMPLPNDVIHVLQSEGQ